MIEANDGKDLAEAVDRAFKRGSSPGEGILEQVCHNVLLNLCLDRMQDTEQSADNLLKAFEALKTDVQDNEQGNEWGLPSELIHHVRNANPIKLADTAASLFLQGRTNERVVDLTRQASEIWQSRQNEGENL